MMLSMLKSWQCPEIQWVHYKQTPVITKGKSESSELFVLVPRDIACPLCHFKNASLALRDAITPSLCHKGILHMCKKS